MTHPISQSELDNMKRMVELDMPFYADSVSRLLEEVERLQAHVCAYKQEDFIKPFKAVVDSNIRLEAELASLRSMLGRAVGALNSLSCLNLQGHDTEYVSRDMAIDAGDRALEGSVYREAEWQECGGCEVCVAKQVLSEIRGVK